MGNFFFDVPIIAHQSTRERFHEQMPTVDAVIERLRRAGEEEVRLEGGGALREAPLRSRQGVAASHVHAGRWRCDI